MRFNILLILSILIFESYAINELNKLNLVQVNLSNIAYKQLRIIKGNILTAPPLAILDVPLLTKYQCYNNIRTDQWSLGIPVIFWNDKYMENITKSINKNNPLKKFSNNETFILPPSGIRAYRLNWKRYLNDDNTNRISLDSSWYNAKTDFVLPMWHTFVIEIKTGHDSKSKCAELKAALLNESLQTSEFCIDFLRSEIKPSPIKNIQIKIKDLISVKEYKESNCEEKEGQCYVSSDFAEKWAYEVSAKIMIDIEDSNLNLQKEGQCYVSSDFAEKWAYEVSAKIMIDIEDSNLNLQKEIFDAVFDFLCKEKISIDLVSVKKLKNNDKNEKACIVSRRIINSRDCRQNNGYGTSPNYYYYYHNNRDCRNDEETILNINSNLISEDNENFSVPISII